jgi:C-terminal processing protease CtpA/Prc
VQVIGINAGDPERKAKAFKAQHKLTFPYLMDREQTVIDQFRPEGLPHLAIIGKDFTLKYSKTGGTVEDLIAKLDEVLTGKATDSKPQSAVAQDNPKVAFLGAETRAPTMEEATRYGLKGNRGRPNGQVVTAIQKGGPAESAGVQKGDILLRLDANEIFSRDDLDDFVRVSKPGVTVKLLLKRDSKEMELPLTLGERPLNEQEAKASRFAWDFAGPAQLDAALKQAKKEGKSVLVGLSGAET